MKARRRDLWVTLALTGLGLGYLLVVLEYPWEARLTPLLTAGVFLLMMLAQLVGDRVPLLRALAREKEGEDDGEGSTPAPDPAAGKRFLWIGAWTVGSLLLIWAFGLPVGIPLALLLFEGWIARAGWATALITGVVGAAVIYGIIVMLLGLPPLGGFVFELLLGT